MNQKNVHRRMIACHGAARQRMCSLSVVPSRAQTGIAGRRGLAMGAAWHSSIDGRTRPVAAFEIRYQ
jgi:hypothetical protein